jgi:alkanesulfonate monooxygenase SsuD/methylene tetrahydromethanopterin reductase-like flavin-dependent oxidoreductase (luciferase family)
MYLSIFVGPLVKDSRDDAAVVDMCVDQAVRAASAGFAMVTFGEQHYNNYEPYCNPFIMAGHVAGSIGEAWVGTTIVPLPFHHPLRLAEEASVADLLLRGRFIMGMSAARIGPVPDWDNFGLDQADRDALFASNLEILQAALAHQEGDPPLRYDTKWGTGAMSGRLMPGSWRKGGPLLAIGSNTDATIERIGSGGFPLFLGPCPAPVAAGKMTRHREAMRGAGYAEEYIRAAAERSLVTRNVIVAETDAEAWALAEKLSGGAPFMDRREDRRTMREMAEFDLTPYPSPPPTFDMRGDPVIRNSTYVQGWMIVGDPESVVKQIAAYDGLGIPQLNVRFTVGRYDSEAGTPEMFEESFNLFLEEVAPRLALQQFAPLSPAEMRSVRPADIAAPR